MIQMFCDCCKKSIDRNFVRDRMMISKTYGAVTIIAEIMVATNGVWNGGEICGACLMDVINAGHPIADCESLAEDKT